MSAHAAHRGIERVTPAQFRPERGGEKFEKRVRAAARRLEGVADRRVVARPPVVRVHVTGAVADADEQQRRQRAPGVAAVRFNRRSELVVAVHEQHHAPRSARPRPFDVDRVRGAGFGRGELERGFGHELGTDNNGERCGTHGRTAARGGTQGLEKRTYSA